MLMYIAALVISLTLLDFGLVVMGNFILLIDKSVLGGGGTSGDIGIVVLGNLLVALLGGFSTSALDSLTDVLGGVLVAC